ncbi:uncharacterized protein LOC144114742 isoform X3 [Amblyomma americanum]
MFMATDSGDLMELAKYQMEHESFTADGPFETDQPVYMATPVDALFFALAPLYKDMARTKCTATMSLSALHGLPRK